LSVVRSHWLLIIGHGSLVVSEYRTVLMTSTLKSVTRTRLAWFSFVFSAVSA